MLTVGDWERLNRRPVVDVCETCGGLALQFSAWVYFNTEELAGGEGPADDFWCEDCEAHASPVIVDVETGRAVYWSARLDRYTLRGPVLSPPAYREERRAAWRASLAA